MSSPYSPFAPPPRPLSAGPRASTSANPSPPHLASASSHSTTPLSSPGLVRPSGFNTRRDTLVGQTRLRARSVGKGSAPPAHLSPTLAGSPVMQGGGGGAAGFVGGEQQKKQDEGGSPLRRVQTEHQRHHRAYGSDESGEDIFPHSSTEGTEESSSTRSDSPPPQTPRDGDVPTFEVVPPSRRGSSSGWNPALEKEFWRTGGPEDEPTKEEIGGRNRSKSLEGQTRMSLRRGRSFTSLLVQPAAPSPFLERKEPILAQPPSPVLETYEPPNTPPSHSDIESGEEHRPTLSLYPPTSSVSSSSSPAPFSPLEAPRKSLRDFLPQLAILISLFVSSFAFILLTISTLPGLFLPHSVSDLPSLTASLTSYRASSWFAELHLFAVLTVLFLWKQCFSIPGSILTNILFGALYGTWMGSAWACLWTATGSTGAYLIAVVITPLVEYYFATPLAATRRALKLPSPEQADAPTALAAAGVAPLSSSDLFSHLMLARLFPLLPYSVLNVISGVLRLPLSPFFLTLLLGSFPFNFATVSIGELVALAAADPSTPLGDKIWSREVVLKLVAVTLVSVVPVVFKEQLKRAIANGLGGGGLSQVVEKAKSAVARKMFGFGALPHQATSTHHHAPSSSLGGGGVGGGPKAWRRKFSRSLGGAGEFLSFLGAGGPASAAGGGGLGGPGMAMSGLSGRRGYERVGSVAEGERGGRNEMSEGVEEMERGEVV
ncbi:hypothetical protein JCM8547_007516 [Rhodosporidiobolus lusitaniae]